MQNAVYRASAPAALTLLSSDSSSEEGSEFDATSQPEHEETPGGIPPSRANTPEGRLVEAAGETKRDREELNPALQQSIFLVGVLDILRVDVDGSRKGGEEFPLLQVRASGTRVEMVQRMYDTSVGMVLQSVEIEDLLHGGTAPECRFLARSFLAAREDLDRSKSEEAQALEALEKESGWKEVDDEGGSGRTARAESEKGREGTEKEPGDDSKRRERAKGARPPRADNGNRGAEAESGGTRSGGEGGPKRDAGESARSRGKEEAAGISITEKAEKGMQSPRSPAGEVEKLDGDDFYDAASTLSRSDSSRSGRSARSGRSPSLGPRTVSSHGSIYFDAPEGGASPRGRRLELLPPSFKESGILELEEKEDEEETGGKESTFVKVVAIMRQTQSPEYRGVDTKVVLDMATLDFFLNRPTVLALMDFAEQITEPPKGEKSGAGALDKGKEKVGGEEERQHEGRGDEGADIKEGTAKGESKETAKGGTEGGEITGTVVSKIEPAALEGATSAEKPAVISGLLGHGKSRVVFGLEVRMQRVQVVLNQDQGGTPLAVLAMLDLSNEVRVFPSSFAVKAELGSLRISDARLGEGHPYGEMFGMQSAAGGSFIMASFESYDPGEDEYFGYDYSLCVRLAAVRTVILYRFVQELSAYFMDLIPPGTGAETEKQLRATVAGVEQWIQQSDVHGQPAIQLDVQMEKPVILMPECSDSKGYIELAIERIALSNEAQWKGGQGEEDMAAVRLDVMTLSIEGLGLRVGGEGGQVGHEIVEEASGLQVSVQSKEMDLWTFDHCPPFSTLSIQTVCQ